MLVPSIMPLLSSSTGFSSLIRVAGANFSPPQHFGSNNISFRAVLYAPGKRASPLSEISPHYEINRKMCFSFNEKAGYTTLLNEKACAEEHHMKTVVQSTRSCARALKQKCSE